MKENTKRSLIIIGIAALALLAAIILETIFVAADKGLHPIKYSDSVEKYSKEYNIPEYIVYAVINAESSFNPSLTEKNGASGLMQIMPDTFRTITSYEHLGENLPLSEIYTPDVNIRYGCYYLSHLRERFGNWNTVFAAYNQGETKVEKWLKDSRYSDEHGNLTYIPSETAREHVEKLNKEIIYYKNLYYSK